MRDIWAFFCFFFRSSVSPININESIHFFTRINDEEILTSVKIYANAKIFVYNKNPKDVETLAFTLASSNNISLCNSQSWNLLLVTYRCLIFLRIIVLCIIKTNMKYIVWNCQVWSGWYFLTIWFLVPGWAINELRYLNLFDFHCSGAPKDQETFFLTSIPIRIC